MSAESTLRRLSAVWLLHGPVPMNRLVVAMPAKDIIEFADHYGLKRSRKAVSDKVNEICAAQLKVVNQSQKEA